MFFPTAVTIRKASDSQTQQAEHIPGRTDKVDLRAHSSQKSYSITSKSLNEGL